MKIEVQLGDDDMGGDVGHFNGRDENDIVDLDGTRGTPSRTPSFRFRISETAAPLRGGDREHCLCPHPDGSADGNSQSMFKQDDGKLGMRLVNTIKIDFIQNALAIATNTGAVTSIRRVITL